MGVYFWGGYVEGWLISHNPLGQVIPYKFTWSAEGYSYFVRCDTWASGCFLILALQRYKNLWYKLKLMHIFTVHPRYIYIYWYLQSSFIYIYISFIFLHIYEYLSVFLCVVFPFWNMLTIKLQRYVTPALPISPEKNALKWIPGLVHTVWNLAAPLSVETAQNPKIAEQVTINGMRNVPDRDGMRFGKFGVGVCWGRKIWGRRPFLE